MRLPGRFLPLAGGVDRVKSWPSFRPCIFCGRIGLHMRFMIASHLYQLWLPEGKIQLKQIMKKILSN